MIINFLKKIYFLHQSLPRELRVKSALSIPVLLINTALDIIGIGLVIPLITSTLMDLQGTKLPFINLYEDIPTQIMVSIVAAIFIFKAFYGILMYFWLNKLMVAIRNQVQVSLLMTVLSGSEFVERMYSDSQLKQTIFAEVNIFHVRFLVPLFTLLVEILLVIFFILFLITFNPIVTLAAVIFFSFLYILVRYSTKKRLVRLGELRKFHEEKILSEVVNNVDGRQEILANKFTKLLILEFERRVASFKEVVYKQLAILQIPRFIYECAIVLSICLIIYLQTYLSITSGELATLLILYVAVASRILPSVNRITASMQSLSAAQKSFNDIFSILKCRSELVEGSGAVSSSLPTSEVLAYTKSVTVDLDEKNKTIIFPDFEFRQGDKICIIGPSGSGKTTLMKLFLHLKKPDSGEFYSQLSNSIASLGYVPQSPLLYYSSVVDNILMGRVYDEALFQEVCRIAEIDFLSPTKNLEVKKLSGGQKQRVSIARALYGKPKILLLDEATSAVSSLQAEKNFENLCGWRTNLSLLLITHDKGLHRFFEKIVEL